MLTVRYRGDQARCYGLFNRSQGRLLIRDRLRRRLVRIPPGTRDLLFELSSANGEVEVPVLRLIPQPRWRVKALLRRKLLNLHPGYDEAKSAHPLPRLWADYNRLLAATNWPLLPYDEWIERRELPFVAREQDQARRDYNGSDALRERKPSGLRFVPGLWGESKDPAVLRASLESLSRQLPGPFQLMNHTRADKTRGPRTWLVLLRCGDRLPAHALRRFADALLEHPAALLLYADEDRISPLGYRHSPQFKPAWNPDLLYSDPHYSHSWLIRSDLAHRAAQALEAAGEPVSLYGLVLEATAGCGPEQIVHLPEVLYHRAERPDEARGDADSAATLQRFLARQGQPVEVRPRPGGGHRLFWPLPDPGPLVSVIIPSRDRPELLRCCLESLDNTAEGNPPIELLLIDNGSEEPAALAYLAELEARPEVTVLRRPGPFNYAALNNEAAALARGELLALLNNDVEALQPGWLAILAAEALRPEIGAVGARLLYDDGQIQHGGVLLGIGGIAGHAHRFFDAEAGGYQLRLRLSHQVSAVTAATLVLRRQLFLEVGGFDAESFAVNYNDVDLCLRLMAKGHRNLYCADAVLIHHESSSRGAPTSPVALAQWQQEREAMRQKWGHLLNDDPYYSPHLSLVEENFSLALRSEIPSARAGVMLPSKPV